MNIESQIKKFGYIDLFPKDDFYFSIKGAIIFIWYAKHNIELNIEGYSKLPPKDEIKNLAKQLQQLASDKTIKVYSYGLMPKEPEGEYIFKRSDLQKTFFADVERDIEPSIDMYLSGVDFEIEEVITTQQVTLNDKYNNIAEVLSKCRSSRVKQMLKAIEQFYKDHQRYPTAFELFEQGEESHGYADKDSFSKSYDRYFIDQTRHKTT